MLHLCRSSLLWSPWFVAAWIRDGRCSTARSVTHVVLAVRPPSPHRGDVPVLPASDAAAIRAAFERKAPSSRCRAESTTSRSTSKQQFPELPVTCFNPESNSEHIQLDDLLTRIQAGEKYRLRADVFLGRRLEQYFDTDYDRIRGYAPR